MKQFAWLPTILFCVSCSTIPEQPKKLEPVVAKPIATKQPESDSTDLSRFSGEYSHNFTCTDEGAIVTVRFTRRNPDNGSGEWRADGEMIDPNGQREVKFEGGHVVGNEDGSVTVLTQFVDFKIVGTELFWLPSYDQSLTKQ